MIPRVFKRISGHGERSLVGHISKRNAYAHDAISFHMCGKVFNSAKSASNSTTASDKKVKSAPIPSSGAAKDATAATATATNGFLAGHPLDEAAAGRLAPIDSDGRPPFVTLGDISKAAFTIMGKV